MNHHAAEWSCSATCCPLISGTLACMLAACTTAWQCPHALTVVCRMCGTSNMQLMEAAAEAQVPRFVFVSIHDYGFPGAHAHAALGNCFEAGFVASFSSDPVYGLCCACACGTDQPLSKHNGPSCSARPSVLPGMAQWGCCVDAAVILHAYRSQESAATMDPDGPLTLALHILRNAF